MKEKHQTYANVHYIKNKVVTGKAKQKNRCGSGNPLAIGGATDSKFLTPSIFFL
jgi:hypothetical protein